jgi:hypothetical protein
MFDTTVAPARVVDLILADQDVIDAEFSALIAIEWPDLTSSVPTDADDGNDSQDPRQTLQSAHRRPDHRIGRPLSGTRCRGRGPPQQFS